MIVLLLGCLAVTVPPPRTASNAVTITPTAYDYDVDLVYTWVNSSDPEWLKTRQARQTAASSAPWDANTEFRFRSHDEIRYSLRSVNDYARWVRKIYIVTCCGQKMSWLRPDADGLTIVDHSEIIPADKLSNSPTYNSNAIEAWVHKIPGLSEHFLLMNDDFMFGANVQKSDFFDDVGKPRIAFQDDWRVISKPDRETGDAYIWANYNSGKLLDKSFGKEKRRKILHQAYPCTKSLYTRAHALFGDALTKTTKNTFRDHSDVISFFLASWTGIYENKAHKLPSDQYPSHKYIKLTDKIGDNKQDLTGVLSRPGETKLVCVGDHMESPAAVSDTTPALTDFFLGYYPRKSRWEL